MPPDPDFRFIVEQLPGLYLIVLPDRPRWTIVAASDAYLRATMTTRRGTNPLIGRAMFEAFPDPPDDPRATGVRNLRSSFERALESRSVDVMAIQHYNIRRTDGSWEERYWAPRNVAITGHGQVCYLLHEVVDVTKVMQAQAAERAARAAMAAAESALADARNELRQERHLVYNLQQDTEQLRAQGEALRQELRRLVEHSGALRDLSRAQRENRRSGGSEPRG